MEELDRVRLPACLAAQLLEDERLEQLPEQRAVRAQRRLRRAEQRTGQPGVADVQFRRLDQAPQPVAVPDRQALQQVHALQQRDVAADRRPAELELRGEAAQVEQPRGVQRRQAQQPRQRVERRDARHVRDIALHLRLDVVAVPVRAPPAHGARERGRVAAADDARRQLRPQPLQLAQRESAAEQRADEAAGGGPAGGQFPLRQGMQPDRLDAPRQRVGDRRDGEHSRRSGQHEAAGHAPPVDIQLEGGEEPGHALHLVEDDALREVGDEPERIGLGGGAHDVVVEIEVAVVAACRAAPRGAGQERGRADHLRERGLPALARTLDQHDGRILQRLDEPRLTQPHVEWGFRHRTIVRFELVRSQG